ncbi:hypothetical protein A2954_03695 [Candidatus Roizmanbacteria bacterium RIFCSPLOWO2_01_FULL_37_12]|uniref:Uncharacterized protein n=1 Tax=Candidatus Roizmanbacteria bacterium RIFCSPLOWO2_01_FULL_37_12 TaxID=1802056 RepID=A0A1F7IEI8_9BACT|nr:MAG: hypothetical protein A3D76_05175 [Candidatus Roizmanbacteria bacterium RIFCSPHIGHO2_02_FULL_37_9b]OGK41793.1 MAG: hypothetical protein A2954_03695 [Candidatus Roizmanbacteria bacterium RIFCSPLOWO2_01_FULL_37_12]
MTSPSEKLISFATAFTNLSGDLGNNAIARVAISVGSGVSPLAIDLLDRNITKNFPHLLISLFFATTAYTLLLVAKIIKSEGKIKSSGD